MIRHKLFQAHGNRPSRRDFNTLLASGFAATVATNALALEDSASLPVLCEFGRGPDGKSIDAGEATRPSRDVLAGAMSAPDGCVVIEVQELTGSSELTILAAEDRLLLSTDGFASVRLRGRTIDMTAAAGAGGLAGISRIGVAWVPGKVSLSLNGGSAKSQTLRMSTPVSVEPNAAFANAIRRIEGKKEKTSANELVRIAGVVGRNFSQPGHSLNFSGKLSFEDDFDELSLRTGGPTRAGYGSGSGIWRPRLYFEENPRGSSNTESHEWQWNADPAFPWSRPFSPFSVQDSVLRIRAQKTSRLGLQPHEIPAREQGRTYDYVSGVLMNEDAFSQTFGYFETRAKLPSAFATWPAFWTGSADDRWPPEIDIVEHLGRYGRKINQAAHFWGGGGAGGMTQDLGFVVGDDFHTFGVLWTRDALDFFIDGRRTQTIDLSRNPEFNKSQYIILQNAIGDDGSWVGMPSEQTPDVVDAYFDWVRCWQTS